MAEPCIIKILGADATGFPAVTYNENKVAEGVAEMVKMKNFGLLEHYQFHAADTVKKYLQKIADRNDRVQHPQLHLMVSYPGIPTEEQRKELLKNLEDTLDKMGYKDQPVLIYAHNDTDNYHFHAVTSRVKVGTGKWINNSFEGAKARGYLDELRGIKHDKQLDKMLGYNYTTKEQFQHILRANGYHSLMDEGNDSLEVYRGLQFVFCVSIADIETKAEENKARNKSERDKQLARIRQVRAIISKYRDKSLDAIVDVPGSRKTKRGKTHSVTSKKAEVRRAKFQGCDGLELSELKKAQFKQFLIDLKRTAGLEILFHKDSEGKVRGYSVIDNSNGYILNGSSVMKLSALLNGKNMREDIIPEELAAEASKEYRAERNVERDKTDPSNIYLRVQEKLNVWKHKFYEPSFLPPDLLELSAEENCQKAVEYLVKAEIQKESGDNNWAESAQHAAQHAYAASCKDRNEKLQSEKPVRQTVFGESKQGAKIIPFVSLDVWGTSDKEGRIYIGVIINGKKHSPKPLSIVHQLWFQQQANQKQAMQDLLIHYFSNEIQQAQVENWKQQHFDAGKMPFGITIGDTYGNIGRMGGHFWLRGEFTKNGETKHERMEVSREDFIKWKNSKGDEAKAIVCNTVGRDLIKDWGFNPLSDIKKMLFDSPADFDTAEGLKQSVRTFETFTEQLCNDFLDTCGEAAIAYFNAILPSGKSAGGGGGGQDTGGWRGKNDDDEWWKRGTAIMGFHPPKKNSSRGQKR